LESANKALIEGYIQKAQKKLEVAEKLFASGDYDDAISRAYYAAYHGAQALLLTEGEKAGTHKGLITLFGLLFVKTGKFSKKMGRYLANLKDVRESGDYEVFSFLEKDTALAALLEAKEFVEEAQKYLKEILK
jgi:uncharacterized protein (UPF0332 family)